MKRSTASRSVIDATQGDFAAVSREHFPNHRLAMTSAVFALIEGGVESDDRSEFAGIWHDILWTSRVRPVRLLRRGHTFKVEILNDAHLRGREFKIVFHDGDYGEPCATVMLSDED